MKKRFNITWDLATNCDSRSPFWLSKFQSPCIAFLTILLFTNSWDTLKRGSYDLRQHKDSWGILYKWYFYQEVRAVLIEKWRKLPICFIQLLTSLRHSCYRKVSFSWVFFFCPPPPTVLCLLHCVSMYSLTVVSPY